MAKQKKKIKSERPSSIRDDGKYRPIRGKYNPIIDVATISPTRAVLALVINFLILPGLGSIIGKRKTAGVYQIILFIIGIPLIFVFGVGLILIIIAWIWGIVTGVQLLDEAGV